MKKFIRKSSIKRKAGEVNSESKQKLENAIYEAITKASFNNGNTINFSREDYEEAFNSCMEKWFEWTDENGNVLE